MRVGSELAVSIKEAARSMIVEVVVERLQRNRYVHFKQRLSMWIGLFDHADVHRSEPCLLSIKHSPKRFLCHQVPA